MCQSRFSQKRHSWTSKFVTAFFRSPEPERWLHSSMARQQAAQPVRQRWPTYLDRMKGEGPSRRLGMSGTPRMVARAPKSAMSNPAFFPREDSVKPPKFTLLLHYTTIPLSKGGPRIRSAKIAAKWPTALGRARSFVQIFSKRGLRSSFWADQHAERRGCTRAFVYAYRANSRGSSADSSIERRLCTEGGLQTGRLRMEAQPKIYKDGRL